MGGGGSVGRGDGEEDDRHSVLRQKEQGNTYSGACHDNAVISPPNCAPVSSIITFYRMSAWIFYFAAKFKGAFHPNLFFSSLFFT